MTTPHVKQQSIRAKNTLVHMQNHERLQNGEDPLAPCTEFCARIFIEELWAPALVAPLINDFWLDQITRLVPKTPTLNPPPLPMLRKAFDLAIPNNGRHRQDPAWMMVKLLAGNAAKSDPGRDWWKGVSDTGIKILTHILHREPDVDVEASVAVFSSLLKSTSLSNSARAHITMMAYAFSTTRGLDILSPFVLSDDGQSFSSFLTSDPSRQFSVGSCHIDVLFYYITPDLNHPLISQIPALSRQLITKSPGLADAIFFEIIRARMDDVSSPDAYFDVVFGKEPPMVASLTQACYEMASDQACQKLHTFISDQSLPIPTPLKARVDKRALDTAMGNLDHAPRASAKSKL